ncbi:unnamed protein product [Aphanomyces euteiches]
MDDNNAVVENAAVATPDKADDSKFPSCVRQACNELHGVIASSLTQSYQSILELQAECMIHLTTSVKIDPSVACHLDLHHDSIKNSLQGIVATSTRDATTAIERLLRALERDYDMQRSTLASQMLAHKAAADASVKRTRLALAKQVDRFTALEQCLRRDQVHVIEEQHLARVQALQDEMDAKDKEHANVLLRQKCAFLEIERFNKTLETALEKANAEIEQLKRISDSSHILERSTVLSQHHVISESYVHSLRHAVAAAHATADTLRGELDKQTKEKDNLERVKASLDDSNHRLQQELTTARQLLVESAAELVALKEEVKAKTGELAHCQQALQEQKGLVDKLLTEVQTQSDLVSAGDLCIQDLKNQLRRRGDDLDALLTECQQAKLTYDTDVARLTQSHDIQTATIQALQQKLQVLGFDKETMAVYTPATPATPASTPGTTSSRCKTSSRERSGASGNYTNLLQVLEREQLDLPQERVQRMIEMEAAIRASVTSQLMYEFKRKFAKQLATRMQQERYVVMQKLDTFVDRSKKQDIPLRRVKSIVAKAFDDAGVVDWDGADVVSLRQHIAALQAEVAAAKETITELENKTEIQLLSLAEAELFQKERDMLLVELTNKYNDALHRLEQVTTKEEEDLPQHNNQPKSSPKTLCIEGHLPLMKPRTIKHPAATRPLSAAITSVHKPCSFEPKKRPATSATHRSTPEHVRSAMKWEMLGERNKDSTTDNVTVASAWVGQAGMMKAFALVVLLAIASATEIPRRLFEDENGMPKRWTDKEKADYWEEFHRRVADFKKQQREAGYEL